jgi:hypothetical protein
VCILLRKNIFPRGKLVKNFYESSATFTEQTVSKTYFLGLFRKFSGRDSLKQPFLRFPPLPFTPPNGTFLIRNVFVFLILPM